VHGTLLGPVVTVAAVDLVAARTPVEAVVAALAVRMSSPPIP